MGRDLESATRRVKKGLSPAARRLSSAASKISGAVDLRSVGGAVAGLTAGEILGGIVGASAGMALGGPVGAVAGIQLGGLTGGSVGLKLGYDVTDDIVRPKKKMKRGKTTVQERLVGVARTVVKRSGDSAGSGAGALGGAVVGVAVGGPVGGAIGAYVGESLAGDFLEHRSVETFDRTVRAPAKSAGKKGRAGAKKKQKVGLREAAARNVKWAGAAMRDALLESGTEATLATVGALAAGPLGARIAGRAGLTAAKRVDWNEALSDKPAEANRRPRRRARK